MLIIFWDYDGTLVNTEVTYKKSLESFFETNNYALKKLDDEYFFKNITGKHPEEFLEKLEKSGYIKQNLNIDPMEIKKYYTFYFNNLKKGQIQITKNIDSVIDDLSKNNNVIMCITSSSYIHDFTIKYKNVENKILNKNFDVDKNVYLCGSINGCKFKPEPDIFIYAFHDLTEKYKLKLTLDDKLIIVEDSATGCKAGKQFKNIYKDKINIEVIGYLGGAIMDSSQILIDSGADIIIKNAKELLDLMHKKFNIF